MPALNRSVLTFPILAYHRGTEVLRIACLKKVTRKIGSIDACATESPSATEALKPRRPPSAILERTVFGGLIYAEPRRPRMGKEANP